VAGVAWPNLLVFVALLLVIAAVAWTSRRIALRTALPPTDAAPPALLGVTRALSWLPFATVVFAAFVPLAATIYLAVTTTWTLAERAVLRRVLL
jgi:YidC/Oxa1 family membrane protein insertase